MTDFRPKVDLMEKQLARAKAVFDQALEINQCH
jgi:hypothetical protein